MWLTDPITNKKSVSLTLLTVTSICFIIFCGLDAFGKVKSISSFNELFYATLALYFGRRTAFTSKYLTIQDSNAKPQAPSSGETTP